jgi:uncharacterized repeat protein (TIGR02543 family)
MINIFMTGKQYYSIWILFLILMVVCSVLTACYNLVSLEDGNGLITVTIGGKNARAIVSWADTLDSSRLIHTITFSGGEGGPHTQTVPEGGGSVSFSVIPGQWTITAEARYSGDLIAKCGKEIEVKQGNNGDVTLQMQKPADFPAFTVSFNSNGGSGVPNETVNKYSKATRPVPPAQVGNGFDDWYKEEECKTQYDFNTPVTKDITLYAGWTAFYYTVTFVDGDKTSTQSISHNGKASDPGFINTGYSGKWYKEPAFANEWNFNMDLVTGNISLYVKWTINTYTVVFDPNGGAGSMADQPFTYETAQNLMNNTFTRTGFSFAGWALSPGGTAAYTNGQSVNNLTATANGTVTLYAVWTPNTYTVVFNSNGGAGSMPNQLFAYGTAQNLTNNAFTRSGFSFTGWALTSGGTATYTDGQGVSNLTANANETITLYAVWKEITGTVDIPIIYH